MAFLEDGSTKVSFVPGNGVGLESIVQSAYAAATGIDYSARIPASRGDELGILLGNSGSDTNRPLQELYDVNAFTGVNVQAYSGSIKAMLNSTDSVSGSLANLQASYTTKAVSYSSSWAKIDKNCNKPDVVVGSQVWAGCNSTIGSTAITYSQTNCRNYAGGTMTCTAPPGGKTVSTMTEADYKAGQSDNIYGAFYQWDTMSGSTCLGKGIPASDTACPCKGGYHLPTQAEWDTLETNLGCGGAEKLTGDSTGFECTTNTTDTTNGLGWTSTNPNSLKNKLGLPLAGHCSSGGSCGDRGYTANYWSSSVYTTSPTSSWRRNLNYSNASVGRNNNAQTYVFSVRCVRD
jgi:uncharacterized protein (TIGR02145 family)